MYTYPSVTQLESPPQALYGTLNSAADRVQHTCSVVQMVTGIRNARQVHRALYSCAYEDMPVAAASGAASCDGLKGCDRSGVRAHTASVPKTFTMARKRACR